MNKEIEILFEKESEVLNIAKNISASGNAENISKHFGILILEYEKLLKRQYKLTKLSDAIQGKLKNSQKDQKLKNIQIEDQNEKLNILNQTKDKFFSIISHDLRNPISSISLMTEIMQNHLDQMEKSQIRTQLEKIAKATNVLFELFEDLHKWSSSQSGAMDFRPASMNLHELLSMIMSLLKTQAENKNITLLYNVDKEIRVYADLNMLRTVIRNLISNSIKFTKVGGKISVKHSNDGDDNFDIISIIDNGIGMPEDIRTRLFKIDETHVSRSGTQKEAGTGLGLIVCKEFIDKHEGRIEVKSTDGEGSTFSIFLPKVK
jgi:signal transduction histidine kinase